MNRFYPSIILILLLTSMAGCTQTDDITGETDTQTVTFRPTLEGIEIAPATRGVSGDVDINKLGFTVVGYHTEEHFPVSDATKPTLIPNIFDKIADASKSVVRTVSAANNFKLPLAKIPLDDLTNSVRTSFSFFAFTAAENKNAAGVTTPVITKSTATVADKGYPFLDIELPAPNVQAQGDVAVAHALNAPNDYVVTAVDLDFHHIFSKISFKAKATSGAVIQLKNTTIKYAANALYTQARYQFNASDSVGLWTGYSAYQAAGDIIPSGFNTPSLTTTESFLGSMFVIPQKLKASGVSVVITYTVTINGKESEPIVRTVPLKAIDLCQGKHYTYTLNIETDRLELINLSVSAWKDAGAAHPMPIIPGAMSDVLLLLDGHDKPYQHANGKWYWLDRSGYNRHCELVNFSEANYIKNTYSYRFNGTPTSGAGMLIPALPPLMEMTLSAIAKQISPPVSGPGNQVLFGFYNKAETDPFPPTGTGTDWSGLRHFWSELGYTSASPNAIVYFDCGTNAARLTYDNGTNSDFEKLTMWTFLKKDAVEQSIYWNSEFGATMVPNSSNLLGTMDKNLFAYNYSGEVSYVEITKKAKSAAEVWNDYGKVAQRFNLPEPATTIKPPVSDALKICLDGYVKPKTINGTLVWEDIGPAKNHAKLMNDKVKWTDDGSYVFTNGGYMELIKTLVETGVTVDEKSYITIEMVFVPDNGATSPNEGLLRIYNDPNNMRGSQIWKGTFSGTGYMALSSYGGGSMWRLTVSGVQPRIMHSLVWRDGHSNGTNLLFFDGIKSSYTGGVAAGHKYCVIGYAANPSEAVNVVKDYYSGKIKAVRIHSRLLTDEEILKNYQFDKEYYGF